MVDAQTERPPPARAGWGLYGRAALFVLVGSGAVLGALFALSELIVRDATARLLEAETRLAVARAARLRSPSDATFDVFAPDAEGGGGWLQSWGGDVLAGRPPPPDETQTIVAALPPRHATPRHGVIEVRDGARVVAAVPVPQLRATLYLIRDAESALAPARAWRMRLAAFGAALVGLFVAFSLLSVHSVARPIRALTAAVRRSEAEGGPLTAEGYGHDEVGELAGALAQWQARMTRSLAETDESREALRRESEAITAHLAALRAISDVSTHADDLDPLLRAGLAEVARAYGARGGALRLVRSERAIAVATELDEVTAERWLDFVERRAESVAWSAAAQPAPRPVKVYTPDHGLYGLALAPHGLRLALVVVDPYPRRLDAHFWAVSLLRHVGMCASHLLLRDADRERRDQQAQYLHQVMKAQEDERSRVARDLHDTVAQDLAALRLEAERLVGRVEDDPALATSLAGFEERARQMLDTVRRILLDLRLSLLESLGFVPASKWLLERMERDHGIETRLLVDDESDAHLEYETAIMLFRILQESLLNVTQHAAAERVFVTIRLEESRVELTVEDDGRGFDPESLRASVRDGQRGLGILGMEERARLLGGALELASAPGEGTTVVVRVQRAARPTRRSAAVG